MHKAAPTDSRSSGYRQLRGIIADRAEADLLFVAEASGMDMAVRSVWPAQASASSEHRLGDSSTATDRWVSHSTIWVPPPLQGASADPGSELHERLVGAGMSNAAAFASRLDWAAAEESWTPGYGPAHPPAS